jgi:cathepsin C
MGGADDKSQLERGLQWTKLTHSVHLIGWGTDKKTGIPYWLVRNSYGERWGEQGNFRVRRGRNDFGCEGNNTTLHPEVWDATSNSWV